MYRRGVAAQVQLRQLPSHSYRKHICCTQAFFNPFSIQASITHQTTHRPCSLAVNIPSNFHLTNKTTIIMSGNSNVGNSAVYEAGDQRNAKEDETNNAERFHEGKEHSHLATDSKDERSIANRLAAEEKKNKEGDEEESLETRLGKEDATLPAKLHGNKPSRGAEIDKQLQEEDELRLKQKAGK
ncbi:hypothetical protein CLIM01_10376 [Colletotrichum limetticola]|uniref:Uncharacterized protein n=1 Tax=Colletotrichum limetticola TaxID=1209924 RepID=A0ABQ9PJQ1_9PEZI|nr:hypothetical protein CLIM01_10376 [Colletotrichum limetticola]